MGMRDMFERAEKLLPELLEDVSLWSTVDVDYETPRVERVWTQVGPMRINLHRIHPCKEALMHPHPWPSAVAVVHGEYEMGVGFGPSGEGCPVPPLAARVWMVNGSYYEMDHPDGWHYVRPKVSPSLSLMVTGAPWPSEGRHRPGKGLNKKPLSDKKRDEIMNFFRGEYPPRQV